MSSKLKDFRIGTKIIGGFILIATMVAITGFAGLMNVKKVGEAGDVILDQKVPIADASMEMMISLISGRDMMGELLLCTDINELEEIRVEFEAVVSDFDSYAKGILEGAEIDGLTIRATENPDIRPLVNEAEKYHDQFVSSANDLIAIKRRILSNGTIQLTEDEQKAHEIMKLVDSYSETSDQIMDKVEALAGEDMQAAMEIADASQVAALQIIIFLTLLGFIIGIAVGVLISRSITSPCKKVMDVARQVSAGDLDCRIDIDQQDEMGQLADSFREMTRVLKGKAETAEQIADGNLAVEVDVAGGKDVLGNSMVKMVASLKKMNEEVQALTKAALAGELDARADEKVHAGDYGRLIGGINELLDAIVAPIQEGASVLSTAANKDLTKRVQGSYKGQLADLKENINSTINALDEALSQVNEAVEQVSSASGQISSGSQSLAAGANQQASSLEEISSSLEEMSSMTRQNSENANQANSLSGTARESAVRGSKSMGQMTDAINRIKSSSDETAKIVKTIDEIAFQTNLLALNAAVEAARAGEAGKGFAVVAEEVRNLAQRSAEAAKDTAAMIEEAVKNAEDGVSITDEVAKVLNEIVDGASRVNDLVAEISAAAGEQTQGIEQINTAVSQMDQLTQQNASNSEESASAAEELNSQAEELRRMVSAFALSRKNAGSSKPALKAAAVKTTFEQKPEVVNRTKKLTAKAGNGQGNGKRGGNGNGGNNARPEVVIPLDDMDFGDF